MKRIALFVVAAGLFVGPALASSHREAPGGTRNITAPHGGDRVLVKRADFEIASTAR
jgi:hypothetical protein